MRRIRSAAEREEAQERYNARYERIYAEVEAEMRAEWVAEFGADNPKFPFVPRGQAIHEITVARITRMGGD